MSENELQQLAQLVEATRQTQMVLRRLDQRISDIEVVVGAVDFRTEAIARVLGIVHEEPEDDGGEDS